MGPSGLLLAMGQTSEADLRDVFAEQAAAIKDAGADGIVIETMSDLAEALLALAAAHETGLPVVACMTFDSGPQKDRTMMGVTPEQAAERLTAAGADVVGANCGHGIAGLVEVCRRMHAATDRPIWIKANAGLPEVIEGCVVYRQTPAEFASLVPRLVESGRLAGRRLLRHDARVRPGGGVGGGPGERWGRDLETWGFGDLGIWWTWPSGPTVSKTRNAEIPPWQFLV